MLNTLYLVTRYTLRWYVWYPLRHVLYRAHGMVHSVKWRFMTREQRIAEMRQWNARLLRGGLLTLDEAFLMEEALGDMNREW